MNRSEDTREREFEDLVPWYVNGTLDEEGRRRFEVLRREVEGAEETIESDRALARMVHVAANESSMDRDFASLERLIAASAPRPGWRETLARWFGGFASGPMAAVAAVLVLVQGVTISVLVQHRETSPQSPTGYAAVRSQELTAAGPPVLKVGFAPDAKESDIRFVLVELGARIVDGPSQLGDYLVEVPVGEAEAAVGRLKSNPIVVSVAPAKRTPINE